MGNLTRVFYSVPRADGICFCRIVIFILSTSGLAVFATTLGIYRTQIAPTDSLAPLNDKFLTINAVTIVTLIISIVWSIVQLTLLARRIQCAYCQSRGGPATASEGNNKQGGNRELVHPGWNFGIDAVCAVLLVVVTVLNGNEAGNWKAGKLDDGLNGTMQVNLKACPSFNQATGMLDYWCEHAWNRLLDLTGAGMSITGTAAGIHFSRFFVACYDLYQRRRCRGMEGIHKNCPADEDTAAPPDETQVIRMEQMKGGGKLC